MDKYPYILRAENSFVLAFPDKERYLPPANPLEFEFKEKLSAIYGNMISAFQKVGYYFPDITYIDTGKNIFIDIEIDEPYFANNFPTHYIGDKQDRKRDIFFTQNGWHVIRFSENQVMSQFDEVIKTIDLFIESIITKSDEYSGQYCTIYSGVNCTTDSGANCTIF